MRKPASYYFRSGSSERRRSNAELDLGNIYGTGLQRAIYHFDFSDLKDKSNNASNALSIYLQKNGANVGRAYAEESILILAAIFILSGFET